MHSHQQHITRLEQVTGTPLSAVPAELQDVGSACYSLRSQPCTLHALQGGSLSSPPMCWVPMLHSCASESSCGPASALFQKKEAGCALLLLLLTTLLYSLSTLPHSHCHRPSIRCEGAAPAGE